MSKYRKKPVVIDAVQWFDHGDHPSVSNEAPMFSRCDICAKDSDLHGWIKTLEGGHLVCPGDWIITGVEGEHYPCKPSIFEKTYTPVAEE